MKFIHKKNSPEEFEKWKKRKHCTKPELEALESEGQILSQKDSHGQMQLGMMTVPNPPPMWSHRLRSESPGM